MNTATESQHQTKYEMQIDKKGKRNTNREVENFFRLEEKVIKPSSPF